ncbi:MAG: ABC transporter substrate-binding protein [Longimicrobiales bacterium]
MSAHRSFAMLLLTACACGQVEDPGPRRLRVTTQPFLSHAPLLLADAEGYFAEQDIEVEFIRLADPAAGVPMLVDGGLDVLAGGVSPGVINAMATGLTVRAVAEKGSLRQGTCSRHGLLIRRALLDRAAGGTPAVRRISLDRTPQQVYQVERMLSSVGLKLADLEQLFIPHLPEMTALAEGTLDAALAGEPWLTLNIDHDTTVTQWVRAEDVLPDHQISFLYFGPNLMNDRDLGVRFMIAYIKAVRQFEEGRTPHNLELLSRITGEGADMIERMCWPAFNADGRIDFRGVNDFQAWALGRRLIETAVSEATFWDATFVDAATRVLEQTSDGAPSESQ